MARRRIGQEDLVARPEPRAGTTLAWIGTTIGASSSGSATCRPPRRRSATTPSSRHPLWRRDPGQPASGEPGAVHGCSPSPACPRASGSRRGRPTRSSGSTRSSRGGSRPRPCCPRPRPRRCCSGRCSPRARSPCARSTAGRASVSRQPRARLTSPPEPIPSPRRRHRLRFPTAFATAPLKAAGLLTDHRGARRTAYSFRHFYTSQQLIAGVDVFLLARNTGTSSDMIERFYGQVKLERMTKKLRPEWRGGASGSHR
jgi:hypothetical protein